jgi:hypothetical protein
MSETDATATGQTTAPSDDSGVAQTSQTTGSSSPPAGAQDTGFRYTAEEGVPPWLVGKTPKEAAQIAGDLYTAMQTGAQPQVQQPQQYQPNYMQDQQQLQQPPAPTGPQPPTQDEWLENQPAAMEKYAAYLNATQFQPALQQQWQATGSVALSFAQQQHKDAFDKWGPEIMQLYGQLDPQAKANAQNITYIVDMVRGRHVGDMEKEIEDRVKREIEEKLATGGSLRPDTAAGAIPPADPFSLAAAAEELPPNYKAHLQKYGIDDQTLTEFLMTKGRGMFPGKTLIEQKKAWLEMAKKEDVITEQKFRMGGE